MKNRTCISMAALLLIVSTGSGAQVTADEKNTIDVFKRAAPAIVHVKTIRAVTPSAGRATVGEGAGTGFVFDTEGHILTNYHVIENSTEIQLLMDGGRTVPATLIGTAPLLDIAVLKPEAGSGDGTPLQSLPFGDSDGLDVGQKVLAIGNPFGFHNTLTVGVLSGVARDLPGGAPDLEQVFLQTDAAINPGNSGGPLLDSAGKVIGVNSVMVRDGQNLGFAIPVNVIKRVLTDVIKMGHVYRPALGFSAIPITATLATLFSLPVRAGLLIQEVADGSPAAAVGLKAGSRMVPLNDTVYIVGGDILTAVNGKPLTSPGELTSLLLGMKPGDKVNLTVLRSAGPIEVIIILPPMHF